MKWFFAAAASIIAVTALAQVPDPANTDAFLDALVKALASGDHRYAAVLVVIGATFLVRQFGPSIPVVGPYLVSSRAGAITALVLAVVTALAPPLIGWVAWSPRIVLDALLYGFGAIGGWVGVRRIVSAPSTAPAAVGVPPSA